MTLDSYFCVTHYKAYGMSVQNGLFCMRNIRRNLAQRVKARQDRRAMKYGRPMECIKLVRQTEQHQCSLALSLGGQALSIEAAPAAVFIIYL